MPVCLLTSLLIYRSVPRCVLMCALPQDAAEMAAALKDRCPSKIDIGPVYNVDPQRRAAYQGGSLAWVPKQHRQSSSSKVAPPK